MRDKVVSDSENIWNAVISSQFLSDALDEAEKLDLDDWWLAGGVVRDAIWSCWDDVDVASKVRDIDLVYVDAGNVSSSRDEELSSSLPDIRGIKWSVKNQARMHMRNNDLPYKSVQQAMLCAPDTLASNCLSKKNGKLSIVTGFGFSDLINRTFRPTPYFLTRYSYERFIDVVETKGWLRRWPSAHIANFNQILDYL